MADGKLWCNVYGQNELKTKDLEVRQSTAYPYDGRITLTIQKAKDLSTVYVRIPEWCHEATITVNGEPLSAEIRPNTFIPVERKFKKGDEIVLDMPLKTRLIESNPLVEENKNQVAVKRGPVVYCLESADIEGGYNINDIVIPADISLQPVTMTIAGCSFTALEGTARVATQASCLPFTPALGVEGVGLKTQRNVISVPSEMPPAIPPEMWLMAEPG